MNCQKCGNQLIAGVRLCPICGAENVLPPSPPVAEVPAVRVSAGGKVLPEIKCGNCSYVGPGEYARSTWAKVLAWLCVIFAPIITIIYFIASHKYRCPNCKSTFVGVKNKKGVYVPPMSSVKKVIIAVVLVLVGIAAIGFISSTLLVSLQTAKDKGSDARSAAILMGIAAAAELYYNEHGNYSLANACSQGMFGDEQSGMRRFTLPEAPSLIELSCSANGQDYAVSASLSSGEHLCVSSGIAAKRISRAIIPGEVVCPAN